MSFTNRLPWGAKNNWNYPVYAADGGLGDTIDRFIASRGAIAYIDLDVKRDVTWRRVRIMLGPTDLIPVNENVFRFESALGVLLDQVGNASGDLVTVTGSIGKETVSIGMPTGVLTIWSRTESFDSEAS